MRSSGVPGPDSTAPTLARISSAVRSMATRASSSLPEKWWYMLPWPASASCWMVFGLVAT